MRKQELASSFSPDSLSAADPVPVPVVETPTSTRIAPRRSTRSSLTTRIVDLGSVAYQKHESPKAGTVEEPFGREVDAAEQHSTHAQEEAMTALERPLPPVVETVTSTSPQVATATASSAEPSIPLASTSTSAPPPPPPPTSPPHPTPPVPEQGFEVPSTALNPESSPLSDRVSTPGRNPSPSPSPRKVATRTITEVEEMAESLAKPEPEASRGVDRLLSSPPPPERVPTPEQPTIVNTGIPELSPLPIPTPAPPTAAPLQRLLNPVQPPIVPSLPVSPTTERPPPPEAPAQLLSPQTQSPAEAKVQVGPSPLLPKTTNPQPSGSKMLLPAQPMIRKTSGGGLSFKRVVDAPVQLERSGVEGGEERTVARVDAPGSVGVGEASTSSNAMDVDSPEGKEQVVTLSGRPKRIHQAKGKGKLRMNTNAVEPLSAPEPEAPSNHIQPSSSEPVAVAVAVPTTPADSSVSEPIAGVIFLPTKIENVEDIFNDDSGDEFEDVVGPRVGVKQVGEMNGDGEKDGQMEVEVEGVEEGLPNLKLKLGGKGSEEPKEVKGSTPVSNTTTTNKGSGMGKQTRKEKEKEKVKETEKEKEKQQAKGKEKDKPDPSPKKRSHPEPSVPGPSSKKLVSSASSKASHPLATVSTPGPTTTTMGNVGGATPSAAGVGASGRPLPSSASSSGVDLSKMNKIKSSVFHPQAKKKPNTVANPLAQFLAPKIAPGGGAAGLGKKAAAMTTGQGDEEKGKRSRYGSGYEPATEEKHKEMAERRIREREERERSRGQGFNLLAQIDSMTSFEHKYRSMYAMRMNEARFVEDRPLPRAQAFGAVFSYFPSKVEEGDEVVGAM